ncbi:MAG: magnesium transporter CorA family protein [Gemmatimonadaceae bacterium]
MTAASPPQRILAQPGPHTPRSYYVDATGRLQRDLSIAELARVVEQGTGQLWVDIDVGNRYQVALLEKVWAFHPLSVEDALNPNSRVKVEEYPGFLFTVIRGVRLYEETEDPYDLETYNLCCYLGRNYVVTVHGGQSPAIAAVADRLARNPEILGRGAARLMHAILDGAVDAFFPILDQIDDFLDGLERRVFERFEQVVLRDIFAVRRLVVSLRRHLGPQREAFNILTNRPTGFVGPEVQLYFRDVYDHVLRISEALDSYRDLLSGTMESYLTQVSNRLGAITKGLAVIGTVSIPFVVVSGMWGMNFERIPLADAPHGFWWMMILQLVVGLGLLVGLRWRGLL